MALGHTNPQADRMAWAPYNFVALPEKIVTAPASLPDHDAYQPDTFTGWFDVDIETCAPVFIRQAAGKAAFFSTEANEIEGRPRPTIPGSSLRGMIRALVEIAGYGRMRWVGKAPTFTFRAVAASRDDPLRDPYSEIIGRFSANVRAGYLQQTGDQWFIQPAISPAAINLPERGAFLKIKEHRIDRKDVPGFVRLNDPDYRPQWYPVGFDTEIASGQRGRYVRVTRIAQIDPRKPDAQFRFTGALVCSGNMKENNPAKDSPRKNHALVLPRDTREERKKLNLPEDKAAEPLPITKEAIRDYLAGLSPFQTEKLTAWDNKDGQSAKGCLKNGAPVFYVADKNRVVCFGHSPNFRVPARITGADHAATPFDFVPPTMREDPQPDFADAIFGWVEEADAGIKKQRAGRVAFGDARYVGNKKGVWFAPEAVFLRTLATPKPTTFQHYLVQNAKAGHNPDDKATLAHFGSSPSTTEIRGHKLYWHRGDAPDIQATQKELEHRKKLSDDDLEQKDQLPKVVPLKPGVQFTFRLCFENLRAEELGALGWALMLPGEVGKIYRHKIGMGKPLGMGAIAMTPRLTLTARADRYARLFDGEKFDLATKSADAGEFVRTFEAYVCARVAPGKTRLAQIERIQQLLTMLEWHASASDWLDRTRYMEIERGSDKINEYKERPVLPDPQTVVRTAPTRSIRMGRRSVSPAIEKIEETDYRYGKVKNFGLGQKQSFGFITPDGGGDEVFVHRNQLHGGLKTLDAGQRVRFKVRKGMQGLEAFDVQPE
ncbi:MAG: TIGR03986 family CRISPR-associated RAMP protein [Chloroflexi bacterium]|nr:TIGR03986 family CRISPR-associated RAMP protein [Chloroflexota bacterium]